MCIKYGYNFIYFLNYDTLECVSYDRKRSTLEQSGEVYFHDIMTIYGLKDNAQKEYTNIDNVLPIFSEIWHSKTSSLHQAIGEMILF